LAHSKRALIVCGTDIVFPREIALAADLTETLRQMNINAGLFCTMEGPNAFSAGLSSPDNLSIEQVLDRIETGHIRALVVVENDLWRVFPGQDRLAAALDRLDLLIVLDCVDSPLNLRADVFMPTQTAYEAGGHWVNQEGRLQTAKCVYQGGEPIAFTGDQDHPPRVFEQQIPGAQPQAAWRIVAGLAGDVKEDKTVDPAQYLATALQGFHPALGVWDAGNSSQRVDLAAASAPVAPAQDEKPVEQAMPADALTLLLVDWTFGTEALSALSPTINQIAAAPVAVMHPLDIQRLGLAQDNAVVISSAANGPLTVQLRADSNMAQGVVVIPRHHLLDWRLFGETRLILNSSQIRAAMAKDHP
jgi:NADH-quinone oxidoreductase subunit G